MDPTRTCNVSKLQAAAVGRTASSPRHPSRNGTIRILCRLQVLEDGIDGALAGTYARPPICISCLNASMVVRTYGCNINIYPTNQHY